MRRYTLEVAGQTHVLDIEELTANHFRVFLPDRELEVVLSDSEDLAEAVITPGMTAAPVPRAAAYSAPAAESLEPVPALGPPRQAPQPAVGEESLRADVAAPMPGTIQAVLVKEGDRVRAGQELLKLEAMKMVNAIKSPRDGVVAEVRVTAGQGVNFGDVLVTFRKG